MKKIISSILIVFLFGIFINLSAQKDDLKQSSKTAAEKTDIELALKEFPLSMDSTIFRTIELLEKEIESYRQLAAKALQTIEQAKAEYNQYLGAMAIRMKDIDALKKKIESLQDKEVPK